MASQVKRVANQEVQIAEESDSDEEEPTIEVVEVARLDMYRKEREEGSPQRVAP
mgnify:CR=1 FL=1